MLRVAAPGEAPGDDVLFWESDVGLDGSDVLQRLWCESLLALYLGLSLPAFLGPWDWNPELGALVDPGLP